MRDLLEEMLSHHTGQPIERIHKDTDRDFVMAADEAQEYGIIDEVITARERGRSTPVRSSRRRAAGEARAWRSSGTGASC